MASMAIDNKLRVIVGNAPGARSGLWHVMTERDEIYVQHDGMRKDLKISLHKSGQGHVAFTDGGTKRWKPDGDRYVMKWGEPEDFKPGGKRCSGSSSPPTTSRCRMRSPRSPDAKRSASWPRQRQARQ